MLTKTRYFGTVDLDKDKIITFPHGIMAFEEYKKWALIYDAERYESADSASISWLQCLTNPELALPVVSPFCLVEEYKPVVDDELLADLGEFEDEDLLVLLVLTVPEEPKKATANFKAPCIINPYTARGIQVIVDNPDYPIRFPIYEKVKKKKDAR